MNKKMLLIGAVLGAAVMVTANSARAADGKELYEKNCAKCHGQDAKGATKMGQKLGVKDYSAAKNWEGLTDEKAVKAVKEGVKDKEGKLVMKPTEGITDDDAKAVVEYMKSLKKS